MNRSAARALLVVTPFVIGLQLALACQAKEVTPPLAGSIGRVSPIGGGTSTTGGDGGSEAGAGTCSTSALDGTTIAQENQEESIPGPIGGTILSGTYDLTLANVYTGATGNAGPTGTSYQETRTFDTSSGTYTDLLETLINDAGEGTTSATSGTFTTSGSTLSLTTTCPSSGTTLNFSYTVEGTSLHIFESATTEFVYTQQ